MMENDFDNNKTIRKMKYRRFVLFTFIPLKKDKTSITIIAIAGRLAACYGLWWTY